MLPTNPCPRCGAAELRPLAGIGLDARACDACDAYWLGPSAGSQLLRPQVGVVMQPPAPQGTCPQCRGALEPQAARGPTTTWAFTCGPHGVMLPRSGIAAVADDGVRQALESARLAGKAQRRPAEGGPLAAAFDEVTRRIGAPDHGAFNYNLVRAVGNPSRLKLGMSSVATGGTTVVDARGMAQVLVPPFSKGNLAGCTALILGPLFVVVLAGMALSGTGAFELAIMGGGMALAFVVSVGMFWLMARTSKTKRIVVDVPRRVIDILDDEVVTLSVPFALATSTRVQLFADPGYSDAYEVLVPLGFAELWLHQCDELEEATTLARRLAEAMGVPHDPELQRK